MFCKIKICNNYMKFKISLNNLALKTLAYTRIQIKTTDLQNIISVKHVQYTIK